LLVELGDATAVEVLEENLDDPELGLSAFDALARLRSEAAVQALARALTDDARAPRAIEALRRIGTPSAISALAEALRGGGTVGLSAGTALDAIAGEPRGLGAGRGSRALLARDRGADGTCPA
jgi:HEAT repeat protein